jgi:hypothetical protein
MRTLLLLIISVLSFTTYAQNSNTIPATKTATMTAPGYCEIEIANRSYKGAYVDIQYDNGSRRNNLYVYPAHSLFVPLYYGGYCHQAAYFTVYSPEHYLLYSGYAYVGHTLTINAALHGTMTVKS